MNRFNISPTKYTRSKQKGTDQVNIVTVLINTFYNIGFYCYNKNIIRVFQYYLLELFQNLKKRYEIDINCIVTFSVFQFNI